MPLKWYGPDAFSRTEGLPKEAWPVQLTRTEMVASVWPEAKVTVPSTFAWGRSKSRPPWDVDVETPVGICVLAYQPRMSLFDTSFVPPPSTSSKAATITSAGAVVLSKLNE